MPFLLAGPSQIRRYFPLASLLLEVLADPEVPEDYQLVLSIAADLPLEDASAKLQGFDEAWWLSVVDQTEGRLCIDTTQIIAALASL